MNGGVLGMLGQPGAIPNPAMLANPTAAIAVAFAGVYYLAKRREVPQVWQMFWLALAANFAANALAQVVQQSATQQTAQATGMQAAGATQSVAA